MKFKSTIHIMPRPEILDPQGKATQQGLINLGINEIDQVRIGRRVELEVEADSETDAREKVELACKKLLANVIIESYQFELSAV